MHGCGGVFNRCAAMCNEKQFRQTRRSATSKKLNPYLVYFIARNEEFRNIVINSITGADGRQRVKLENLKSIKHYFPDEASINLSYKYLKPMFDKVHFLNNDMAIAEIQKKSDFKGVVFNDELLFTKEMVSNFFEVEAQTIERYLSSYTEELTKNGYEILRGKELKKFLACYHQSFGSDINVGTKITILGVFNFRAFLNLAMLLSESEKVKLLRQMMLDIVIDLINKKTGGATKYINQRDKYFILASLQEDNYRRQFTDALKLYVTDNPYKYAHFTDLIYMSIFKEKSKEYKKILDLKASDKVRDTFYSEILNIIAAYECGLADAIKVAFEKCGRLLSHQEVENLFETFENLALWKPLIHRGRIKMASRDMALRDAFHYQLSEYIKPLDEDEYQKFIGIAGDELERLMEENRAVLKRLKERE